MSLKVCHNEFGSSCAESYFMKNVKKIGLIVFSAVIFSACGAIGAGSTSTSTGTGAATNTGVGVKNKMDTTGTGNTQVPAADQKVGDTTKTGTITQSGDMFFITVMGQEPEQIESYAVDLKKYVGQTVTVTGQFSGDTLFVGSVK